VGFFGGSSRVWGGGVKPGRWEGGDGCMGVCQRLLPYKPDAAEPLLWGLQLVPALNPEVKTRTNGGWRAVWWAFFSGPAGFGGV
jgi:hypothetical protein